MQGNIRFALKLKTELNAQYRRKLKFLWWGQASSILFPELNINDWTSRPTPQRKDP